MDQEKVLDVNEHDEKHEKTEPKQSEKDHSKDCKDCKKHKEEIHHLKREIEDLKTRNLDLDDSYKRKVAEFDNYRKRMLKQVDDSGKEANRKLVLQIFPILDNFARAIFDAEANKNFDSLLGGLKITRDQIKSLFDHLGIKEIDSVGREFDPNLHEALMMEETDSGEFEKTVVMELEKGYTMGDLVVRHAKVKVAKRKIVS